MPIQLSECRVISIHLSDFYISCMCWGFTENMSIMQMNVTFAFCVFLFEWSHKESELKKVKENLPSIITYIALLGDATWRREKKLKLMITSNGCFKIEYNTKYFTSTYQFWLSRQLFSSTHFNFQRYTTYIFWSDYSLNTNESY